MDKRRVIEAPGGYGERVRLALRAAGRVSDIARACGVSELYVYQARSGHRGWSEPSKLAAVAGVPEVLLVYGPTEELGRALGRRVVDGVETVVELPSDADEYDRAIAILGRGEEGSRALVNPVTLNMLRREHLRRYGVGATWVTEDGWYTYTGNLVGVRSSPVVPVGAVMRESEHAKLVNGVDGQVVIVEES